MPWMAGVHVLMAHKRWMSHGPKMIGMLHTRTAVPLCVAGMQIYDELEQVDLVWKDQQRET